MFVTPKSTIVASEFCYDDADRQNVAMEFLSHVL